MPAAQDLVSERFDPVPGGVARAATPETSFSGGPRRFRRRQEPPPPPTTPPARTSVGSQRCTVRSIARVGVLGPLVSRALESARESGRGATAYKGQPHLALGDEVGQVLQRVVEVVRPERRELEVLAHLG